jgi:hypothetical protein
VVEYLLCKRTEREKGKEGMEGGREEEEPKI